VLEKIKYTYHQHPHRQLNLNQHLQSTDSKLGMCLVQEKKIKIWLTSL